MRESERETGPEDIQRDVDEGGKETKGEEDIDRRFGYLNPHDSFCGHRTMSFPKLPQSYIIASSES